MRHRLRAGLIHLCLSAAIAAAVFLPIYFFWFPDVLYESAGGRDLFLLVQAAARRSLAKAGREKRA